MPASPPKFKTRQRFEDQFHARELNFACYCNIPLLRSQRARGWVLEAVQAAQIKHAFALWAYCVMPSHVHMLVLPARGTSASSILQSIKQSVARKAIAWIRINAPTFLPRLQSPRPDGSTSTRFWQRGGGFDRNLWSPHAIWDMIDYIHMNPVRESLCATPLDWPHSSARAFLKGEAPQLPLDLTHLPQDPRQRGLQNQRPCPSSQSLA